MVGPARRKSANTGCTEGAWVTSQLRHNNQASQVLHGADDITTLNFYNQVNSMSIVGPQVDTLFYYSRL